MDGSVSICPSALCALTSIEKYGCMTYITAEEEVNFTTIQCVHEQSLTGICILLVFYLLQMDHLFTNS